MTRERARAALRVIQCAKHMQWDIQAVWPYGAKLCIVDVATQAQVTFSVTVPAGAAATGELRIRVHAGTAWLAVDARNVLQAAAFGAGSPASPWKTWQRNSLKSTTPKQLTALLVSAQSELREPVVDGRVLDHILQQIAGACQHLYLSQHTAPPAAHLPALQQVVNAVQRAYPTRNDVVLQTLVQTVSARHPSAPPRTKRRDDRGAGAAAALK